MATVAPVYAAHYPLRTPTQPPNTRVPSGCFMSLVLFTGVEKRVGHTVHGGCMGVRIELRSDAILGDDARVYHPQHSGLTRG